MTFDQWQLPDYLEKGANGRLKIDGIDIEKLAQEYKTPLFAFSQKRIRDNIKKFKKAFSSRHLAPKICYACKANSNIAILKTVYESGLDIEVNSGGELFKALKVGFQPRQIVFNGVGKTVKELKEAIVAEIYCLNVDSMVELGRIINLCDSLQKKVKIAFRVVPEIRDGADLGLETGTNYSKFGISESEIIKAYKTAYKYSQWLEVVGLHAHIGSQMSKISSYLEAVKKLLLYRKKIYESTGNLLQDINLGGGFPIHYNKDKRYEESVPSNLKANFQIEEAAEAISQLLPSGGEKIQLILEPGRSIVGDAGILLTNIQNYKIRPHSKDQWLILDAGFNILLESFDYKWYFQAVAASRINNPHNTPYRLAGPLCDAGDVFFDLNTKGNNGKSNKLPPYRFLPEKMSENDTIAFLDIGAYTLEQMFPYNGQPCAKVVMIDLTGNTKIIRHRDTYQDLISKDIY